MILQRRVSAMGSALVLLLVVVQLVLIPDAAADSLETAEPSVESRMPRWVTASPSGAPAEETQGFSMVSPLPTPSNLTKTNTSDNITAQLGASVFLPCKTHHSMERQAVPPTASSNPPWGATPSTLHSSVPPHLLQHLPQVSWVRRRDWHILTSGTLTYTKEARFSVHHPEGSTEWTLAIKYVELSDAGTYECQISTGGGIVSHLVHLNVVVPRAVIPGNGEYHVDTGSTISLDCFIEQSPKAPQYIFWYHNSRMINYDKDRSTVHIDTGPRVRSRLTVNNARSSDSGNYTCAAANTDPASITVYITEANKIAAIQPRAVDGANSLSGCLALMTALLFLCHALAAY
ncbi:coxsackievirus and adenovirus receptor-like [Penaeus monodon]|uniref:coxsackievirus and adenovirus receptor-like n=1 Tax=Penaeus monodon TaxID=6687 RepID=UPI0018A6EC26|nr:coxsackievirus and adenovirus receptor-like [Penaeus monodon]